jgi:hypothetical protein
MIVRIAIPLACLSLCACGAPDSGHQPPGTAVPTAVVTHDAGLTAEDIGAAKMGSVITVPAGYEVQLAVAVIRDGAFSPADSMIYRHGDTDAHALDCSIIAFAPHGPLRPDASDYLVQVAGCGKTFHVTRTRGAGYGGQVGATLVPGAAFAEIAMMYFGDADAKTFSSDIDEPADIALAVHLFARLAPLDPAYMAQHHGPGSYGYAADDPLTDLAKVHTAVHVRRPAAADATPDAGPATMSATAAAF